MPINEARRIKAIGTRAYAYANCTTMQEAEHAYRTAVDTCHKVDARYHVRKLREYAKYFGMTIEEFVVMLEEED